MAVSLSPIGGAASQFFNSNGVPLSGGKMYTYEAGTTTPKTTFTEANGLTAHSNPIILNSTGRVPGGEIWLTSAQAYKFVLKASNDTLIGTWDNVYGLSAGIETAVTEVQIATAGQTDFLLTSMIYVPGSNTLGIYVDGVNQIVNVDYTEVSSTLVTFTSGISIGAEVKFIQINRTTTSADMVSYFPAGASAVLTDVESKLQEFVSAKDVGVVYTATYDENIAKANRTKIEALLRDTVNTFVVFPPDQNTLFICGSVHPLRNDLTIWQQTGCNIVGYEQNSAVSFAGHLFGFVQYANPDVGLFTVTGTTSNITYILDGDIQTAYSSAVFGNNYNNNSIAFYDVENCQVIGSGGISKSNHDGINFDGLASNCHVDINYVKDCSTVNIQMIGAATSFNTVRAKYIYNDLFDDTVNQPTARSCVIVGGNKVLVEIGSIVSTKAFPIINVQKVTEHAEISVGSVDGNGSQLVRMYATKAVTIHDTKYSNLQYVVSVAGVAGDVGIPKTIIMDRMVCMDSSVVPTTKLVNLEMTPSAFQSLIIKDCNFYNTGNLTTIVDSMTLPYFDISGTTLPAIYNYSSTLNPRIKTVNVAANGTTTFNFDSNTRYGIITKVHLGLSPDATPTDVQMASVELVVMGVSSGATYYINVTSTFAVTVTRSGTVYTFTAPANTKFFYAEGEYA